MYRVVGRGRVACIGLGPGLDLKLGNPTSIFGPRTQTQAWQFEPELDRELGNSDSDPDSTSNLVTQPLDLELELKLSN